MANTAADAAERDDHFNRSSREIEEWLRSEGVRLSNYRETYHQRHSLPPITYDAINYFHEVEIETVKDAVYTIEVKKSTLFNWRVQLRRLHYIFDEHDFQHGHRTNFYSEQQERHLKLLNENKMYRDLWNEVRALRSLLGETNHWP